MAKYLLLKHYRGAPAPVNDVPMDQWSPEEISAHMQYMRDFAVKLEEAGEYVDVDQLCLSGQCGFSSTVEGNALSHDKQWAKLALIVETAREVWG